MKVLAFGSRTFRDAELVGLVIEGLQRRRPGTEGFTLVHGAARGADSLAADAARALEWSQIRAYPAHWRDHDHPFCPGPSCAERGDVGNPRCRGAGVWRNQRMLNLEHTEAEPIDLAVGFIDKPLGASRGSHDMFKRCRTAELAIWMVWAPTYRAAETFQEPPWVRSRATGQAPAWSREIQPGVVPIEP